MRTRRMSVRAVLAGAAVLGVLVLSVAGVAWHAQGGRWFVTTSPSMGTELPVGTFLLTRDAAVADVEVGDVVTFASPGSGTVFTHRAVAKDATGLQTQGDVNGVPDAWVVTDRELVGDVAWHAPGLGYVAQAVPLLMIGTVAVWLLTRWCASARRRSLRLVGTSAVLGLVGWWLSPWVGMTRLGQSGPPAGEQGVVMQVISTGLLPIQAREVDGPARAHLADGQVGELHLTGAGGTGAYDVTASIDLPWWGWVVLGLICLGPMWSALLTGAPDPATQPDSRPAPAGGRRRATADAPAVGGTA